MSALLSVRSLSTQFRGEHSVFKAVDKVSFDIAPASTLGVVGESGSGKSVSALSILRLILSPGEIVGGEILFEGRNLLDASERQMRDVRGNQIAMVFQEPMTSLNPVYTVGNQVAEPLFVHRKVSRKEARTQTIDLFRLVGIADPEKRVDEYPHQLSGGMRQRVMIAMALACRPKLLIADEPTTALDVTIQAQILDLLERLQRELGMAMLLITHDLGVVAETCDDVVVMYAGHVVERASATELFSAPRHPYTAGLLRSIPSLKPSDSQRLQEIPGMVPRLDELPVGCRFQDRCSFVEDRCRREEPTLETISPGRLVRCFYPLVGSA